VRNSSYTCLNFDAVYVAEGSNPKRHGSRPLFLKLDENEIRAIRKSLEKITRRRIVDAADAEDIVQETLLAMITSNPRGELKKGVHAWSRGILRNKVGNYYRKSRRHEVLREQNGDGRIPAPDPPAVATQEITLSNKEIRYIIDRKLEEFTPEVRRVMELLVSGLKAGEIVAHLHPEPYQNIINRLYRGRKKLVRELIRCGFGPRTGKSRNRKAG
jgi:RNA polymerase sigma factor (sigma-70 family)